MQELRCWALKAALASSGTQTSLMRATYSDVVSSVDEETTYHSKAFRLSGRRHGMRLMQLISASLSPSEYSFPNVLSTGVAEARSEQI